jgi:hypothetical protein
MEKKLASDEKRRRELLTVADGRHSHDLRWTVEEGGAMMVNPGAK